MAAYVKGAGHILTRPASGLQTHKSLPFRVFPQADRSDGDAGAGGGGLQSLQGLLQPGPEGRGPRLHRESGPPLLVSLSRGGNLTVHPSPAGGPHHHHVPGGTGRGVRGLLRTEQTQRRDQRLHRGSHEETEEGEVRSCWFKSQIFSFYLIFKSLTCKNSHV